MFTDTTALLLQDESVEKEEYFWVDGNSFRGFLSCEKGLDNKLKSTEPIVCSESMLCCHGYLHPSIAVKGKLLRKPVFDAYVALLAEERKNLIGDDSKSDPDSVVGRVIRASEELICKTCRETWKEHLKEKVELIKNMLDLYDAFVSQDGFSKKEDPSFYVIPRTFITEFKKLFLEVTKSVGAFDEGAVLERHEIRRGPLFAGIDGVNLKPLMGISSTNGAVKTTKNGKEVPETVMDPKVNTKITCSHGNRTEFGKNRISFAPPEVWALIKKVYPDAIEHKALDDFAEGVTDNTYAALARCPACDKEENT
ncbi:MAG: hypothetical protein SGILL_007202, partial [Bacillariaceae sp.]